MSGLNATGCRGSISGTSSTAGLRWAFGEIARLDARTGRRAWRGITRAGPAAGTVTRRLAWLQALSRIPFGTAGDTTQRFTYLPDFKDASAYRSEAEVTAQAAMNSWLALRVACLWRYSNAPVPGFVKSDNTATASVVLRWRSAETVPVP